MPSKKVRTARLEKDLSEPVPIPDAGIERAVSVMQSGRLFRYGEFEGGESEVAQLERQFADYMGSKYAAATNSCGSAMFVALKSAGVKPGDDVLVNAFTLAPVPGAVEHVGANPVFVECDENCCMDLDDFAAKARSGAKVLLLSHMRGHMADMDRLSGICRRHGIMLIEDCAHTLGARWNGRRSGTFGDIACFSLQAFKHINAGEGGILTTDDEEIAAKAILYSGSYMLYAQNGARPPLDVFERHKRDVPNFSLRMNELTAAVARPQIGLLDERAQAWRERYQWLADLFASVEHLRVPERDQREEFVPSSIQFFLTDIDVDAIPGILDRCRARGVDIKWFGSSEPSGFTSTWQDWKYVADDQSLPETRRLLELLCDMRIPVTLTEDDCRVIAAILDDAIRQPGR